MTTTEQPARRRGRRPAVEVVDVNEPVPVTESPREWGAETDEPEPDEVSEPTRIVVTPAAPLSTPAAAASLVAASTEIRARQVKDFIATEDDLSEMIAGLEFGENQHTVKLSRLRVQNAQGHMVTVPGGSRYLDEFNRPVSLSEMKDLYGGGEFNYVVYGPLPGGKRGIRKNKQVSIEGESMAQGKPLSAGSVVPDGFGLAKDLIAKTLDAKDRENTYLRDEVKELKKLIMDSAQKDTTGPLVALMEKLETQRLAAETARLAAEAAARKDASDKEERRVAAEALVRKETAEREEAKLVAEKTKASTDATNLVAMMKQQTDMMLVTFKETMASKESQNQAIISTLQNQSATQLKMLTDNFTNQFQLAQQQTGQLLTGQQALADTERKMLLDALKDARSEKKGGIKEMVQEFAQLKQGMDIITGQGPQAAGGGGIVDTVKEVMGSPGFGDFVRAFTGSRGVPVAPGPAPATAVGVVQVTGTPNAPVLKPRQPSPWPTTTGAPPREQPAVAAPARPAVPKPKPRPGLPKVGGPEGIASGHYPGDKPGAGTPRPAITAAPPPIPPETIGVVFPPLDAPLETRIQGLIQAVDTAIRAEWNAEQIWASIVSRFDAEVLSALRQAGLESAMKTIEEYAPASVLNTGHGLKMMQGLFELLGQGE